MSLQSSLNNQALSQLPKIWAALSVAKNPAYSNIYFFALNAVLNSAIPLDFMSDAEKIKFDLSLYSACVDKGLLQ